MWVPVGATSLTCLLISGTVAVKQCRTVDTLHAARKALWVPVGATSLTWLLISGVVAVKQCRTVDTLIMLPGKPCGHLLVRCEFNMFRYVDQWNSDSETCRTLIVDTLLNGMDNGHLLGCKRSHTTQIGRCKHCICAREKTRFVLGL